MNWPRWLRFNTSEQAARELRLRTLRDMSALEALKIAQNLLRDFGPEPSKDFLDDWRQAQESKCLAQS